MERHEGKCNVPSNCRGCPGEFPRRDFFDVHVDECPEPVPCDFCGTETLPRDIDRHEDSCNEPIDCTICLEKYPRLEMPQHESQCDGPKPEEPEVDPKLYLEHVERQRKKLQKKSKGDVFVEDDYVKPEEFRDPGNRKNKDIQPKTPTAPTAPKSKSKSIGRKSSKSPVNEDVKHLDGSQISLGRGSIEHEKPLTTPTASRLLQTSPFVKKESQQPDSQDADATPKGILKDNNRDSLTPMRQNS